MEQRVLGVYERFRNLQKLKKPLYLSAFTIVTSCKEAMEAQGKAHPGPMDYLECLMSVRDNFKKITQVKDEGYIYALSAVISMVPLEVVAKLSDLLYEFIDTVIENTTNTLVLKYCSVVLQFLLESKTKDQWKNEEQTINIFMRLFHFGLHSKDLVKRQAIRSFMVICHQKDPSYFNKAMNELEKGIVKVLDQADVNKSRAINCLNFINCVIPVAISPNIVKKLAEYSEIDNLVLKKHIYFVIETIFAATKLSTSFVEEFLIYLLKNVPVATDTRNMKNEGELMIAGYCVAVAQVAVHYKKCEDNNVLKYLPTLISILSEFLISGIHRIKMGAFTAIKNIIVHTLSKSDFVQTEESKNTELGDLNFDLLTIRDENTKIHPLKKICMMFQYCLNSRFESCYSEVIKLISEFINIGAEKTTEFGGIDLLTKLGDLGIKRE